MAALRSSNSTCSLEAVVIRRVWDDMSDIERLDYIDAVICLDSKPARIPAEVAPGARNWRDDFVYAHINQTNFIHLSGLLLPWHRQFIWAYEQSLRTEFGYTGSLPYWAWERHSANQSRSPVWQPGPASFGANGDDFYSSPNDPMFYLLHPQIDRIWTIWQGQDYESRQNALDGTLTLLDRPPSPNATVESIMKMSIAAGGDIPIGAAMNAIANDYCYMYA